MSRSSDRDIQRQEEEARKEYMQWFEGRSIQPIKQEKRDDEPRKFIYDEDQLPF